MTSRFKEMFELDRVDFDFKVGEPPTMAIRFRMKEENMPTIGETGQSAALEITVKRLWDAQPMAADHADHTKTMVFHENETNPDAGTFKLTCICGEAEFLVPLNIAREKARTVIGRP